MKIKTIIILVILLINNNTYANDLKLILPSSLPKGLPSDSELVIEKPKQDDISFNQITISNLLTVIFTEIETNNYVLSSEVLNDNRLVSFRYNKSKNGSIINFITPILNDYGYDLNKKNNTIYVDIKPKKNINDFNYYVYIPKYRTADYISKILRPYFSDYLQSTVGAISTNQPIDTTNVNPSSALNYADKTQDFLTFKYDDENLKKKILSFIEKIDIQENSILARAYIYEVNYTKDEGSGIGMILNLANNKLKFSLGSQLPLTNLLSFSSSTLSILLSNINNNSRVKLLSNPILRVKNNSESKFIVGNSVPLLGNITTTNNTTQQAVNYVDTGLIFKIKPRITRENIVIDYNQEISDAVKNDTGVNNTPILTKRNLETTFNIKKNEVVILSALSQEKKTENKSTPLLLPFITTKNYTNTKTDIVIFFEVVDTSQDNMISLE